jgi:hypothetical protein
MTRKVLACAVAAAVIGAAAPVTAGPPATWDDLVLTQSSRFGAVYLLPGADFRAYRRVMIEPVEVAFRKDWLRDYNARAGLSRRITEADAEKIMDRVRQGVGGAFAKAFRQAGWEVAAAPGPDVLRLRIAVIDLTVTAPDVRTGARTLTYARDSGGAALAVEARDSTTDALLGRAVDRQVAGDRGFFTRRNSATNEADFEHMFESWAKASVEGLAELTKRSGSGAGR